MKLISHCDSNNGSMLYRRVRVNEVDSSVGGRHGGKLSRTKRRE